MQTGVRIRNTLCRIPIQRRAPSSADFFPIDRPTDRPDGFRVEVIPTFSLGRDLGLFTAVHPEDLLGETRAQVVICCYLLRLLSSSAFVHFFHPKQTPSEKGGDSRLGSILVETKLRSLINVQLVYLSEETEVSCCTHFQSRDC